MRDPYLNGDYAAEHPGWHEEDADAKADAVAQLLHFGGLSPRVVVDVGCGSGGVLHRLHARFAEELPDTWWEGWDPAVDAIERARRREGGHLQYVCGDLLQSERRADVLLALDVVEHVADDVAFLEALRERAPVAIFRFPLDLSVLDVLRPGPRLLRVGPRYGLRHLYTRELVLQRLNQAGYRVIHERYHRIPVPKPGWSDRLRVRAAQLAPHGAARWLGGFSLMVLADGRG
jgi:SAM-dependent methyltransferase